MSNLITNPIFLVLEPFNKILHPLPRDLKVPVLIIKNQILSRRQPKVLAMVKTKWLLLVSKKQLWNGLTKAKTLKTCNLCKTCVSNTKVWKKNQFYKMRKNHKISCKLSVIQIFIQIHMIKQLNKVLKRPQLKDNNHRFWILLLRVVRLHWWRVKWSKNNKLLPSQKQVNKQIRPLLNLSTWTIDHHPLTKVIRKWKKH